MPFFLLAGIASVSARPIVLKIGSPTPKGSPWDNAIRSLAMEWSDITDGQVQMKIYSGGVAGDEADMIRKMNFNSLQGGVFTSLGLEHDVSRCCSPQRPVYHGER